MRRIILAGPLAALALAARGRDTSQRAATGAVAGVSKSNGEK
jgi:hypothetical protein